MKTFKPANFFITGSVFLIMTVAVVAGQSRANDVLAQQAIEPIVLQAREVLQRELHEQLRTIRLEALKGHN